MKRHIHHQTVGARRAVPLVQTTTPVGQEIGCGIGHGTPCRYGGGIKSPFRKRYTKGTGSGTARRAPTAGFTLVELVVVIVIVGILSALGGQFIVAPVTGYVDLSRRARLVDQAEMALRRMQRDIRHALPNSISESGTELSFINTFDGGRYRRYVAADGSGDILDFSAIDDSFDVLGNLRQAPTTDHYIVIYNVTSADTGNRRKVDAGSTVDHLRLEPILDQSDQFPQLSPSQRFFVVDHKVTYKCEGDELNRYQANLDDPGDGTAALVTRGISGCEFTYDPGVTQRAGLVTMRLTLEEEGEQITLLHQVHVVNAP